MFLTHFLFVSWLVFGFSGGEDVSKGKRATQIHTWYETVNGIKLTYPAHYALEWEKIGSRTWYGKPAWWQVDLLGYFTVDNVTLTASTRGNWGNMMRNAYVVVMDREIGECSDRLEIRCGTKVPSAVTAGSNYTFTCNAQFPVRFVRIWGGYNGHLAIGHVEVQGRHTTERLAYYKTSKDRAVTGVTVTTGAKNNGECGILCHKHPKCLHFSYSKTAQLTANCLMTNRFVPTSTSMVGSTLYTLDPCTVHP